MVRTAARIFCPRIDANETETEEQLSAKLEQIKTASAAPDLTDIRAELAAQKRRMVEAKVITYVDAHKITKAEVGIFVEAALKDESGTIKILDEKPSAEIGGEPVGFNRIEIGNHPVLDGYQGPASPMTVNIWTNHTTPQARYDALKAQFPRILNECYRKDGAKVMNAANSFAAAITTNFLIVGAITQLGPQIAPLKAFSRDNTVDPYKPLAVGIQKYNTTVQDGSDTLTSPTDWSMTNLAANAGSTLLGPTITPLQYSQPLYLTNAQLNSGIRMADMIEAKLGSFRAKIASVVTAPITLANFGTLAGTTGAAAPLVSAAAAFGFSDLALLQGGLKKSVIKNLVLDGEYIARIANTPAFFQNAGLLGGMKNAWNAFGWDLIALNTVWPAGENVVGFACNPQAIGIISGLPLNPPEGIPGNTLQIGVAELAGPDIAVQTYLWFDLGSRSLCASYDIILGASAIDKTAGIIIKSA